MDELKIVKLAELRSRMSGIPVKMVVTVLITAGIMWQFRMDKFKENISGNIVILLMMYGIISYFWLCIKLTGNWIIGIIAAIVLIFVWQGNMEKLGNMWSTVIGMAICFGGPVLDVLTVIQYFFLRKSLFAEMEEYGYYEDDEDDEDDEEAYEEYQRQQAGRERQESRKQEASSPGFFSGCKDTASIKRRYRDLCKVYHPDTGNGSSEVFNKITEEYNRLMEGV